MDDLEPLLAIGKWPTNAAMIRDIALSTLPYIRGHVLDPTYGEHGGFWTEYVPEEFTYHDAKLDGVDFRDLGYPNDMFDTVVFDPPYKLNGRPDAEVDARYGVDERGSIESRHTLMRDGLRECVRVCKPGGYVLTKQQDQVASGKMWWQTDMMTQWATEMGCVKVDSVLFEGYRKQPAGRRQVHVRRNYSTLLVFQKKIVSGLTAGAVKG